MMFPTRYEWIAFSLLCLLPLPDNPASKQTVNLPVEKRNNLAIPRMNMQADTTSLLPIPQQSNWAGRQFNIDKTWTFNVNDSTRNIPAVKSLQEEFANRYKIKLAFKDGEKKKSISLKISGGAVKIGSTIDTNRTALSKQAYQLGLSENNITITANAAQGLFYGVQSLLQLMWKKENDIIYPGGEITDWPNMNLRMMYWDDAHHLEKMEVLKREIRQAAFYKINGFAIKLEGHFAYKCAAPIVEPHALSPGDYQELTDYAAAHYVQLIPYLDAPAHVSFILKHPEYKALRAFPNSNYQFTVNNQGTYDLVLCMFKELIDANKGVEYVLLSNDEAYYTGKAANEIDSAKALGGNGKLLAKFIARIADSLKQYGRKPIFWGEYPLVKDDIKTLPRHLINGVYDSSWASSFKDRGIRQLVYTSTQGEEPLFPNYYPLPYAKSLHEENRNLEARVPGLLKTITQAVEQQKADLAGVIVAGWADAGLHPQTFWLGYATGTAMGWNLAGAKEEAFAQRFYTTFYKTQNTGIEKIYREVSQQAQFYEDSWEWQPTTMRTPIFGNHAEIFITPEPARDQSLLQLPVPRSTDLSIPYHWADSNKSRLQLAGVFLAGSDELMKLLKQHQSPESNSYNIEVIESVAALCRQNITMLFHLRKIDELLQAASRSSKNNAAYAISLVDESLDRASTLLKERNAVLASVVKTWYKDWRPLVIEANGRKYLHAVDDVKDHEPIRTPDLSYLIYRELLYPLDKWAIETLKARNDFAVIHSLKKRTFHLDWKSYK